MELSQTKGATGMSAIALALGALGSLLFLLGLPFWLLSFVPESPRPTLYGAAGPILREHRSQLMFAWIAGLAMWVTSALMNALVS